MMYVVLLRLLVSSVAWMFCDLGKFWKLVFTGSVA